eukprot:CAMPEP_0182565222 /NCGR_PEP_ID=MMETSP1324-20130603/6977_1 /TAXON_ID=236786 /ORGANISM="Florenciella sp., Strain RCC1587" /LENGTH=73 /DNA_ID=CAMNT_0024778827 /DNA_START=40 /DNA_END=261 /DNA_ORIENTATION=+
MVRATAGRAAWRRTQATGGQDASTGRHPATPVDTAVAPNSERDDPGWWQHLKDGGADAGACATLPRAHARPLH